MHPRQPKQAEKSQHNANAVRRYAALRRTAQAGSEVVRAFRLTPIHPSHTWIDHWLQGLAELSQGVAQLAEEQDGMMETIMAAVTASTETSKDLKVMISVALRAPRQLHCRCMQLQRCMRRATQRPTQACTW